MFCEQMSTKYNIAAASSWHKDYPADKDYCCVLVESSKMPGETAATFAEMLPEEQAAALSEMAPEEQAVATTTTEVLDGEVAAAIAEALARLDTYSNGAINMGVLSNSPYLGRGVAAIDEPYIMLLVDKEVTGPQLFCVLLTDVLFCAGPLAFDHRASRENAVRAREQFRGQRAPGEGHKHCTDSLYHYADSSTQHCIGSTI